MKYLISALSLLMSLQTMAGGAGDGGPRYEPARYDSFCEGSYDGRHIGTPGRILEVSSVLEEEFPASDEIVHNLGILPLEAVIKFSTGHAYIESAILRNTENGSEQKITLNDDGFDRLRVDVQGEHLKIKLRCALKIVNKIKK